MAALYGPFQLDKMQRKLPHMPWYPGDWLKDVGIQSLSYYHRGIWHELLMRMWESSDRGRLVLNGKAMSDTRIAQLLGLSPRETADAISVILESGVGSRDADGALISRRMVRDEEIRQQRADAGHKGGKSAQLLFAQAKVQANLNQNPDIDIGSDNGSVQKQKQAVILRIGALFRRRDTTRWSEKEIAALSKIVVDEDDLTSLECYYSAGIREDKDYRRRDLLTLLNNWTGEVDRAQAWRRRNAPKNKRVTAPVSVPNDHDPVQHAEFLKNLENWRAQGRPLGDFPTCDPQKITE